MIDQILRFTPVLKEKIWGGQKLIQLFGKQSTKDNIGESWEISDVTGDETFVASGVLKGKSLKELIKLYKRDFLGKKVYEAFGNDFPLLIKFIDAKEKLSIQLHPDDSLAQKRHNSFGKTEMWYVMQADEKATIVVGFKKDSNEAEYLYHLTNKSLLEILNVDKVAKGDVYFIPTGRIHAIGAGVLLAEIQQTSDNTYRVYDWDRKDKDGNERKLHTHLAKEAIDYKALDSYKTNYSAEINKVAPVVDCPYFTTNIILLSQEKIINHSNKDSFVIYMCVEGEIDFLYNNQIEKLRMGETLLLPACVNSIALKPLFSGKVLEVFIR